MPRTLDVQDDRKNVQTTLVPCTAVPAAFILPAQARFLFAPAQVDAVFNEVGFRHETEGVVCTDCGVLIRFRHAAATISTPAPTPT